MALVKIQVKCSQAEKVSQYPDKLCFNLQIQIHIVKHSFKHKLSPVVGVLTTAPVDRGLINTFFSSP